MNYKNFTRNEIIMLKLIILLRRDLMGWKIITVLAYFLKLYGIFLISNCILIEIDNLEVSNYIKVLTLFGNDLKETSFFIKYYNVLFFTIISIALAYTAAITCYLTSTEVSPFDPPEKNKKKLTIGIIALEKFISYTTFSLIFLSQHLIEFLSLSIVTRLNTLPTSAITDPQIALVQTQIANFSNSLLINPIIYLVLGVVLIVIINLTIFFYFYYLNEPLLNYNSTLKYTKLRHFPILIALMTNFQGIVLYDTILDQTSVTAFHLILTCLTFLFGILFLIKHYRALTYFNAMKMSTIFMINYGVIACLVNVIYKYSLETPGVNLSSTNLFLKILNEAIIAYGVTELLAYNKIRTYFNKLSKHLFKKDKRIKNEILLFLGEVMKNSITNPKDLLKLTNIFSQHSIQCKNEDCDCKKMDLGKLYSTVNKLMKDTSQFSFVKRLKTFSKNFSELISLIECVIVNSISKIKPEEIANDSLILLHIDYVSYFKRSYLHANYLISVYCNILNLKLNSNDKVKFFLLKNNNFERYDQEVMHDHFFVKFNRHFKKIKKMKKLILNNCMNINEVISIRTSFIFSEEFTKSDRILELSQNMKRNDKRLMKEITQYPHCLRNSQFCYMISNYYSMTHKRKMPKKLIDLLSFYNIAKFDAEYIANQKYPFAEMNMMNPVIVSIKEKENFRIKYACTELCEKLNYKREDLIGQDINIFLPGIMARPHKIILKNKILIQKLYEIKKKTFILSHDNYYVPAEFYSSFSTNFSGEIEIIINIQLYGNKDKKYNKYFFLIDDQFNIISHSKNFEENYFVTRSVIQKTKLTIISMLNLNYEKIMNRFQSNIDLISSVHMENAENIVSVLHSVDFTKEKSELKKFGKEKVFVKISKTKLISTLEKIKLCLEEYDSDKKVEIKKLKQIIQEFSIIRRNIGSPRRITGYMKGESVKEILSTNDELEDGNNFLFELELKQMGDLHFYYGKLYEKKSSYGIYTNLTMRNITNESLNSFYQLPEKNQSIAKDTGKHFTKPSLFCPNSINSEINYDERSDTKNSYTALFSSSADLMSELKFKEKKNPKRYKLKLVSSFKKNKATDDSKKTSATLSRSFFSKLNEIFILSTLFILLLCHAGFFLHILYYSKHILTESENIFFINYYALSLKSSIFYTSSAILSSCIIADMKSQNLTLTNFPLSNDLIKTKLSSRLNEVLNEYAGINTYLGKVNTGFNSIYDILNKQDEYYLIYKDWSQYSRQSTLENEVIYFRNYIYPLITSTDLEQCMLTPFYGGLFHSEEKVNTDQFTLFYIIKNAYTNYRSILENISDISTQMIIANQVQIKSYFSVTNSLLLILSILLLIFIYVEIKILESNVKWSIEKILLLDKKKFIRLNHKLDKFIQFLKDLNKDSCKKFETSKAQMDNYGFNPPVVNLTTKKQDDQTGLENSEMRVGSLFIGKISKILIILGFVFYLSVTVAQLILRSTDLNDIVYANKISISILRRFSDLIELDIYYKLAVIQNNPYYVNVTQADYDALIALGLYDKFVQDSDELYQQSMGSYFSYVYFKASQDIQNIDDYMLNYKSTSFMNNTRAQEEMLSDSNFCEEISNFFFKYNYKCPSAAICASLNVTSIQQCEIPLNSNGFEPGLNAILTNLKNYYLDYLKFWESNPGQSEVSKYIYNSDILSGTMNIEGVYKKIHSNVVYTINEDIINLYNQARLNESFFTIIQISFDFGFLAFIIFAIFLKLKKHSHLLKKFYENMKKKLNREK